MQLNIDVASMLKNNQGLYYTIILKITTPTGEVIKIPVNSSYRVDGFPDFPEDHSYMILPGEKDRSIGMRNVVHSPDQYGLVADLQNKMATSIRYAIKSAGYRFTSLKVLEKYKKQGKQVMVINGTPVKKLKQLTPKYRVDMYVRFEVF